MLETQRTNLSKWILVKFEILSFSKVVKKCISFVVDWTQKNCNYLKLYYNLGEYLNFHEQYDCCKLFVLHADTFLSWVKTNETSNWNLNGCEYHIWSTMQTSFSCKYFFKSDWNFYMKKYDNKSMFFNFLKCLLFSYIPDTE